MTPAHPESSELPKKIQLKATLPLHIAKEIEQRGRRLQLTKAEYLALIASWWFGKGSPAVNEEKQRLIARKA